MAVAFGAALPALFTFFLFTAIAAKIDKLVNG